MTAALVAVLLPTTGRPKQARACAERLLAQTYPPGVGLLVVAAVPSDDSETLTALSDLPEVQIVVRKPGTTAVQGWNAAYRFARQQYADWYVLAADDLVFGEGWLLAALEAAEAAGAQVVGLDDGGHTYLGNYAPHYMAVREWTDAMGGCIAPPEYGAWWFDREVCERAKAQGAYTPSPGFVEHRHPDWGTAPLDDTYRGALRLRDADRALYLSRQREGVYA